MNEQQCERLELVESKLIEVALNDADPENWCGSGLLLHEMSSKERGDANWCRKTAVQTMALLNQVQRCIAAYRTPQKGVAPNEPDPEAMIREAEATAREALERIGGKPSRA